jgi:hypothetical protein
MQHESVFPFDIGRESAKFPGQLIIPFRVSDWQEDFDDNGVSVRLYPPGFLFQSER